MPYRAYRPQARTAGLVQRELDGEVLVYDRERDTAICLNDVAAGVWRRCDGATTPEIIAQLLDRENGLRVDERAVWQALEQLAKAHLLETVVEFPPEIVHEKQRREFLRAVGAGAAMALPIILSIVVPTPAQAATCLASGQVCAISAQCCSGLCSVGFCV